MLYQTLTALSLLPALIVAVPTRRDNSACAPLSYTISDFTYTTGISSSNPTVHLSFKSTFSDTSIISDESTTSATCDATGETVDKFPNETECSTGRDLLVDLRAPVNQAEFQIIHTWMCEGQTWMSSTPHKIAPLDCNDTSDGTKCTSVEQTFTPQNVRQICSTPTCP